MKKSLLATTAIAGAGALFAGTVAAAEAPTWKLGGYMKFQAYWVDQDRWEAADALSNFFTENANIYTPSEDTTMRANLDGFGLINVDNPDGQDHDWYFGLDDSELTLKVDGAADNGLKYGFKVEISTNTTSGTVADEARIQLAGSWGTVQLGDEDGAEDIMNYGGENLIGGAGGWDGDAGDFMTSKKDKNIGDIDNPGGDTSAIRYQVIAGFDVVNIFTVNGNEINIKAPDGPTIEGDTSDATKISYYSPRFSGFQVGASITPTPNNGDDFKEDGSWENHVGLGVNYDQSFGSLHLQASAVYSMASNIEKINGGPLDGQDAFEDVSAFSVGGIVGWGPFSVAGNYTDNGESGQPIVRDVVAGTGHSIMETSYYNVAARYATGPMKFSVSYFASTAEIDIQLFENSTFEAITLAADYKAAPGLAFYAEIDLYSEELMGGSHPYMDTDADNASLSNETTALIVGTKVSF